MNGHMRLVVTGLLAGLASFGLTFAVAAELPTAITFSGDLGEYTLPQWKRDWPGCQFQDGVTERRVSLHEQDAIRWLRVTCRAGEIGPAEGGAGWRWPFGRQEQAELVYQVRFDPEFDFARGGKLPGFGGGPENVGGGTRPTGENGFTARLMWREEGRGEVYVYHLDQPEETGESLPFPEDFRFPPGETVQVRLALTMNRPGQRDGVVRCWTTLPGQPERLMVERRDLCWRTVETFGVDSLYFQTFHGGSSRNWAPQHDCWVEYAEFQVRTPRE